ncbi:AraC family transcriptional regulator [Terrimonas alba]|uniref:AraC family transcriptional regulator n=1 Tax=Terrimonas alba TaxID=3349636 RepID=UPI0035F4B17E
MHLSPTIQTLSGEQLQFEIARPPGYQGLILPGFVMKFAKGYFGSYFIQEFKEEDYLFQYCVLEIRQRFITRTRASEKDLYTRISLQHPVTHKVEDTKEWKLKEGEFAKIPLHPTGFISQYDAGLQYTYVDVCYSSKSVKEAIGLFPEMDLQKISAEGQRVNDSIRQHLDSILHCRYTGNLRRHFFISRIKDMLIDFLVQWSQVLPENGHPTQREIDAVYKAEKIIIEDISKHFTIPELARMVRLSEYRFKIVFKKVFGVGAYEYLQTKRLRKARQMLEQGYLVKEVAAETGYHVSYFINMFRDLFNMTPGSINRKKKE